MIKILLLILVIVINTPSFAQISDGGEPRSFRHKFSFDNIPLIEVPMPDMSEVIKEDMINDDLYKSRRFGIIIPVKEDFFERAIKREYADGNLWQLRIRSKNALALIFYSSNFLLPDKGELFLYNKDKTKILGAFTSQNNNKYRSFATELLESDEMVLEYFQPYEQKQKAVIEITEISYAYRDIVSYRKKGFGDSQSCEVNVNCLEGSNYRRQQRGVVKILVKNSNSSTSWCSGSLVNNTRQDFTPYLLSAAHCIQKVQDVTYCSQFIFYFNYETPGCSNVANETFIKSKTLVGADVLAYDDTYGDRGSDFLLMKLFDSVPKSYNPFFNGWSRLDEPARMGACIHQPNGDVKKISTFIQKAQSSSYGEIIPSTHWRINWAKTTNGNGVTEGGSSGSPLFNEKGLIVGTLTGGTSECNASATYRNDYFGKMHYHWSSNGNTDKRKLGLWLDSKGFGYNSFEGIDYDSEISIKGVQRPENIINGIYPNPASSELNVLVVPNVYVEKIFVRDILGKTFIEKSINACQDKIRIDISDLNSGTYFISINNSVRTIIKK